VFFMAAVIAAAHVTIACLPLGRLTRQTRLAYL